MVLDSVAVLGRFEPRELSDAQRSDVSTLRGAFKRLAKEVLDLVPPGREQSIVLTHLEEASFMAVAGIARANG